MLHIVVLSFILKQATSQVRQLVGLFAHLLFAYTPSCYIFFFVLFLYFNSFLIVHPYYYQIHFFVFNAFLSFVFSAFRYFIFKQLFLVHFNRILVFYKKICLIRKIIFIKNSPFIQKNVIYKKKLSKIHF